MRILKIVPQAFFAPSGTPLSAYHRARELVARGHDVDILTYAVGSDPPDLKARVIRARGPHFARTIKSGPSRLKIWFDVLLFANLLVRVCLRRYDLLYAHEEGALLARIVGGIFRIPYVYDMHSSLPLQITEWQFSQSSSVIRLFQWVERVCVRGAHAVVAISPAVERAARTVDPNANCVVLYNHFDTGPGPTAEQCAEIRSSYGIQAGEKLVVYTGSFVALQSLELLLKAIPLVTQILPSTKFLLVGGTDAEIASLRRVAREEKISGSVIFEHRRPQNMMPAYWGAADVLVSPRVRGINPPGKLLPYLAAARPVVATDTPVHNQILTHASAILTAPNAQGIADGIIQGLSDSARVAEVLQGAQDLLARCAHALTRERAYDFILSGVRTTHAQARPQTQPTATQTGSELTTAAVLSAGAALAEAPQAELRELSG